MSAAHVTRLELDTNEADGVDVVITARRVGPGFHYGGQRANAADLPPDVADVLRKWLEDAPTGGPA